MDKVSSTVIIREGIYLFKQVKSPYWWVSISVNGRSAKCSTKVRVQDDSDGKAAARTKAFDIAQKLSLEEAYENNRDDESQREETLKVVLDYHMAWKNRDIIEIMALFHPDIQYHDFFTNRTMGLKEIPAYIQASLPKKPGERLTHTDRIRVDGHTAFIQYNLIMKEASYRSSEAITVKDGLITKIDEYGVLLTKNAPTDASSYEANDDAIKRLGLSAKELANLSEDLQQYFKENKPFLDSELSLQQVADETGYSRNQLSYFLNKVSGQTFYEYVHQARIEYLVEKISKLNQVVNVDQLAFDAGFNSLSVFYKHFKRITGQSPKAYLKAHLSQFLVAEN